jgi:site-specific recombinase XerD
MTHKSYCVLDTLSKDMYCAQQNTTLREGSTLRKIQRLTLSDGVQEFFKKLKKQDLSPTTLRGYQGDLDLFKRWAEELNGPKIRISQLSEIDLMAYRNYMMTMRRFKAATINRRLEALRKFFRWAVREKLVKIDITNEIKSVKTVRNRSPQGLTEGEIHAVLRAAGESKHGLAKRNYALVQLMVQAGLRVGEVAKLCTVDVVIQSRSGLVRVQNGKGQKQREIPLNATARRALKGYLQTRCTIKKNDPLFSSTRGDPISVRSIQSVISSLARRAKVKRIEVSPHSFRHTFALGYIKQNPGKLVELATLLGHDSLDTTAIYTRPSAEDLAKDLENSQLNVYG